MSTGLRQIEVVELNKKAALSRRLLLKECHYQAESYSIPSC